MTIQINYVKLYTKEGRLLKKIPRADLPKPLPQFLEYAGNIFGHLWGCQDYSELDLYHYAEKALASEEQTPLPTNVLPLEGIGGPNT